MIEERTSGPSASVGDFASIAPSARLHPTVRIGAYASVHEDVVIGSGVVVGERVSIREGARIGEGVAIDDGAIVGAGVTVHRGARLRMGAVLHSDVPRHAVVAGNPAAIVGYVDTKGEGTDAPRLVEPSGLTERMPLQTGGCFLDPVPNFADVRGSLTALEHGRGVPFEPRRVFLVHGVGSRHVRGEHAHRVCEQFLVAVNGSLSVMIDDGRQREEVRLSDKSVGLYLAPGTWGVQYKFSPDCILMVLASHPYDDADYIRDYDDFLHQAAQR